MNKGILALTIAAGLTDPWAPVKDELRWFVDSARAPTLRTMREFAEQEIVIPEGKYQGRRWRAHRQPFAGLLLDCFESRNWNRFVICGCVQAGKTFHGYVIPLLFSLFEKREAVICGLPSMDLARQKWTKEVLPVIMRSRYRDLLPTHGDGSRGGTKVESVIFKNGATLEFMSGGGGDERRSGATARVVCVTEVDKMDTAGEVSREADPITQLEARTLSYDASEKMVFLESTVSIEEGRIWQEYTNGTASRIVCPCPYCGDWVQPEREHLVGWQEADTKAEAARLGYFGCPSCGERFNEPQRRAMNESAKLVHRGQEITAEGQVVGRPVETDTLGFRWNAWNNLFWSTSSIAAKMWAATHADDEENAEKEVCQFWWARPYEPPLWDSTPLSAEQINRRQDADRKGFIPADTAAFTIGVDLGKRVSWWLGIAWQKNGTGHIVDYGSFEVPSDSLGVERALALALKDFREWADVDWPGPGGELFRPNQVWIDAGFQPAIVYDFIRGRGKSRRFRPAVGRGMSQSQPQQYNRPKTTGSVVRHIGEEYHISWVPKDQIFLVEANADHWKSFFHERLSTPMGEPGKMTLFRSPDKNEHRTISKHFTAEKQIEEFVPGRGTVKKWVQHSRANHYFDCAWMACAAGHLCGVRLLKTQRPNPAETARVKPTPVKTPDGRAYLATERK